jgi:surface protein
MSNTILVYKPTSVNLTIVLFIGGVLGTNNITVNWGDGNSNIYSGTGIGVRYPYTYTSGGTFTVTCSGITILGDANGTETMTSLTQITQFGNILTSIGRLSSTITSVPNSLPSSVTSLANMFNGVSNFNDSNVSSWNVSNVTTMTSMFSGATSFNKNISSWNVQNVTNMGSMFSNASSFNQSLSNWNVQNVTNMAGMFDGATNFNQDISSWNVSNVSAMNTMFRNAIMFNQSLLNWNVSNVKNMSALFFGAVNFNQSLANWNVSNVTNMAGMFNGATSFNGDISNWSLNTTANFFMQNMFSGATSFNQNLANWNVRRLNNGTGMFNNTPAFTTNFTLTLIGWASLKRLNTSLFQSITLGNSNNASNTIKKDLNNDTSAIAAYNTLTSAPNAWTFNLVPLLCILEGNKILCFENDKEIYKNIETLTTDDVVITYLHGHKKIKYIYKNYGYNDINNYNQCVYKMEKTNDMIDDLYLTGGHSIMVDDITEEEYNKNPINDQIIDNKKLIPAFVSSKFNVFEDIQNYTCYNLLLENDGDIYKRYGIYCNGVLIETPNEECMSHHI